MWLFVIPDTNIKEVNGGAFDLLLWEHEQLSGDEKLSLTYARVQYLTICFSISLRFFKQTQTRIPLFITT